MVDFALPLDSSVKALLQAHPTLVNLFLAQHLDCIGCAMNKYCNLEDVFELYDLPEEFMATLKRAINTTT